MSEASEVTERRYYKVLRKTARGLRSCSGDLCYCETTRDKVDLVYPIGDLVSPLIPTSKLFVFGELDLALRFIGLNKWQTDLERRLLASNYEIWECECFGVGELSWMCGSYLDNYIERFWSDEGVSFMNPPLGTYGCDSLKLLKKVENMGEVENV